MTVAEDRGSDLERENAELRGRLAEREAELAEALEKQTATAEVLQVINSSPGNVQPVFDAMLDKAISLCEATYGNLWTYDGERFHLVATHGDARFTEWIGQRGPVPPSPGTLLDRITRGEGLVHIQIGRAHV